MFSEKCELFFPNNNSIEDLKKTTHLAIAAHQDDVELMAYHGVCECYEKDEKFFTAVIVTNGSGSPKGEKYKNYSNEEFVKIRNKEQKDVAIIGKYLAVIFLNFTSDEVKDRNDNNIVKSIVKILLELHPKVLYIHNIFDSHKTHFCLSFKTIEALNLYHNTKMIDYIYGCEVWRSLDWISKNEKISLKIDNIELLRKLISIYKTQIDGNKDYLEAVIGRMKSNATFNEFDSIDNSKYILYAIDMKEFLNIDNEELLRVCNKKTNKIIEYLEEL